MRYRPAEYKVHVNWGRWEIFFPQGFRLWALPKRVEEGQLVTTKLARFLHVVSEVDPLKFIDNRVKVLPDLEYGSNVGRRGF